MRAGAARRVAGAEDFAPPPVGGRSGIQGGRLFPVLAGLPDRCPALCVRGVLPLPAPLLPPTLPQPPAVGAPPVAALQPTPQPAPQQAAGASLAKLADSFRALSETVKEQQQRLGRVEKQFGLPNSAAPAERMSKATVEDVGWPLDLNKPKDRESVDKAISFHDL